ncbi:MAG: hypothetical protein WCP95_12325 [Actinomycetes bacterium]
MARLWLTSFIAPGAADAAAEPEACADDEAVADATADEPPAAALLDAPPDPLDEQPATTRIAADAASTLSMWNLQRC